MIRVDEPNSAEHGKPRRPTCRKCRLLVAPIVALTALLAFNEAHALDNGLAKKPPMAYSNWNIVGPTVNESFIRDQADFLVNRGLKEAGYEYVIVDDCWSNSERSADGKLEANLTSFPSGMSALSDYIHGLGLKFGMYADAGKLTCQNHPGSLGYEEVDAQSFADWGVDYLKYDNCHASAEDGNVVDRYSAMSKALNKTGRPILYSIVGWGVGDPWRGWGQQYGNTWRTDGDITQSWPEITRVLDNSVGLMRFSRPHAWADMDMLEVGVGALTFQEMRSHFALWALMKSPLMLGTNLGTMSDDQLKLVSNKEVIAVNQDDLGVPGDLVWKQGPYEVYAGPMQDGSRAVCMLNRHTLATQYKQENMTVEWKWIGLPQNVKANVRNILDQQDYGVFEGSYSGQVIVHDVLMLRITPVRALQLTEEWRPWSAQTYTQVKEKNKMRGWEIAGLVILGIVAVGVMGFGLSYAFQYLAFRCATSQSMKGRVGRNRDFQRFDDQPTPKARTSPSPNSDREKTLEIV